jgi:hypothetical protein
MFSIFQAALEEEILLLRHQVSSLKMSAQQPSDAMFVLSQGEDVRKQYQAMSDKHGATVNKLLDSLEQAQQEKTLLHAELADMKDRC